MKPLLVEVVAYAPTQFYHCTHCEVVFQEAGVGQKIHAEQIESGIPDDLMQDYRALSDWVNSLMDRYGDKIAIKIVDAASMEGFWKSLRYGVRKYPAVIVAGQDKHNGTDFAAADASIAQRLAPAG